MDCVMRCAFGQVCDGVCDRAKAGNTVPGVAAAGASPERALEKQAGPGEDLQLLPWVHQREVRTKDYQQRPAAWQCNVQLLVKQGRSAAEVLLKGHRNGKPEAQLCSAQLLMKQGKSAMQVLQKGFCNGKPAARSTLHSF